MGILVMALIVGLVLGAVIYLAINFYWPSSEELAATFLLGLDVIIYLMLSSTTGRRVCLVVGFLLILAIIAFAVDNKNDKVPTVVAICLEVLLAPAIMLILAIAFANS